MKETLLWILFAGTLVGILFASKDGFYRYPCQDPKNWSTQQCQPPVCVASNSCPEELMGDRNGKR